MDVEVVQCVRTKRGGEDEGRRRDRREGLEIRKMDNDYRTHD